jgi:hypothetical protein
MASGRGADHPQMTRVAWNRRSSGRSSGRSFGEVWRGRIAVYGRENSSARRFLLMGDAHGDARKKFLCPRSRQLPRVPLLPASFPFLSILEASSRPPALALTRRLINGPRIQDFSGRRGRATRSHARTRIHEMRLAPSSPSSLFYPNAGPHLVQLPLPRLISLFPRLLTVVLPRAAEDQNNVIRH